MLYTCQEQKIGPTEKNESKKNDAGGNIQWWIQGECGRIPLCLDVFVNVMSGMLRNEQ